MVKTQKFHDMSNKFSENKEQLERVVQNWDEEQKGIIIFESAEKYLESKYGSEIHKKSGETLVSITLKEPSFWEWYLRIVNIVEKQFIHICKRDRLHVPIEAYRLCIENIEQMYNINKSVTYHRHQQNMKSNSLIK